MDLFSYMLGKKSGGSGGGSGDSVDAEKLDLYEKFFKAQLGISQVDYEPYETELDGVVTKVITGECRGIPYTIPYNSTCCAIYPEMNVTAVLEGTGFRRNDTYFPHPTRNSNGDNREVVDMSRLHAYIDGYESENALEIQYAESTAYMDTVFAGLPDVCRLSASSFYSHGHENSYSQGISFGKEVIGMSAKSFAYDHTTLGDKPVWVMEGFKGSIYLAKLNISAEHMLGIINNLADMSGTGTTYTLNFGSHNTAKLTDEQIAVATEKGWNVT